jgi:hypothetical protein
LIVAFAGILNAPTPMFTMAIGAGLFHSKIPFWGFMEGESIGGLQILYLGRSSSQAFIYYTNKAQTGRNSGDGGLSV